jgi:plasmid stability protein
MNQAEPINYKVQTHLTERLGRAIRVRAAMADKSTSDYVREILIEHMKKVEGAQENI